MATTLTTSYQRISTIGLTYGEIRTYAKYSSQSIANNTTTYQLKSTYYTGQAGGVSFSSATGTLDGTTRSYGYTTMYKGETTISEVSRTLTHNNDGSSPQRGITTSWSATFGGGGSTSGSIVAPKINRYATLTSAPDFNDEGNPTINYSNPAGNNVTTLQACITTWSDGEIRVPYRDISKTGTSYTFNLTEAERNTLRSMTPNSNTLSVGFWVKTITGGTTFWSSAQKTMTIVNGNPTFTHSEIETNTTVSNLIGTGASTIVQNLSRIKFTITPTAKKSATIKKVELTHNNSTTSDTTSPYEFTLTPVNNSFTVKVTDSRNNVTTQTFTKTMLNYAPVKINSFSFKRANPTSSDIKVNLDTVYWNTNIGSTTNAPVVKWKMNNGSWNTIPSSNVIINNTSHKITVSNYTLSNQLVYTSGATFYISVNDAYSSTSNNVGVTKGIPILDLGDNEAQINGDLLLANTSGGGAINPRYKLESPKRANVTNANITHTYENDSAHLQLLIVTSSMTSNKPAGDGFIVHTSWDNSGQYVGQLYLPNANVNRPLQFRGCSAGTWGGWENIYREKVLYNNTSGTNATITLSENYTNFTYLEVFYGNASSGKDLMSSCKVQTDKSSFETIIYRRSGNNLYINTATWKLGSSNKLTPADQAQTQVTASGATFTTVSNVYIYRVVGYR